MRLNSIPRRTSGKKSARKIKNYALKSMDAVHAKLEQAILYVKSNPMTVKSITSFPYITRSF